MSQGGQNPDGWFARSSLGSAVNALLSRFEYQTITLADAGKAAISDTAAVHSQVTIHDTDNDTSATFYLQGGGNAAVELGETGTDYGTTEDNDGTTNVYWDAGSSRYELNNETGGEVTYEVVHTRVP